MPSGPDRQHDDDDGDELQQHAQAIAERADGAVVGTAIVDAIAGSLDANGAATQKTVAAVTKLVSSLAKGVRAAARQPAD